jgi:hypothetical protein
MVLEPYFYFDAIVTCGYFCYNDGNVCHRHYRIV